VSCPVTAAIEARCKDVLVMYIRATFVKPQIAPGVAAYMKRGVLRLVVDLLKG
jgi:hypothetical protein